MPGTPGVGAAAAAPGAAPAAAVGVRPDAGAERAARQALKAATCLPALRCTTAWPPRRAGPFTQRISYAFAKAHGVLALGEEGGAIVVLTRPDATSRASRS